MTKKTMAAVGTSISSGAMRVVDLAHFVTLMTDIIMQFYPPLSSPADIARLIISDLKYFQNDVDLENILVYNGKNCIKYNYTKGLIK